ncbi:MAG: SusC/RagA family TonB-linked outer membrane protein [Chitinophagaceae bacterium]|nr:SusC/RagA family TonB-linked outer membrane protein [Chitinophagaceae bacterium]
MRKLLVALTAFLLFTGQLLAQKVITGKVTDDKGVSVPNASVVVKGTSTGTTTKSDGSFSLTVPSGATTLVISSVGMVSKDVAIGSGNTVNAQLVTSAQDLSEVVVVVPYGTVKKTAFTGSENTISAAQITKQQVTSVTRALEGLIPGIMATNGGGAPGTGASILIRGVGSVNATSAPLYVLNGIPYDGSITAISTDDIESVTVLKDAAAAALYGSRAANGVVMITTKKGRRGKATVSASLRQGFMSRGIPEYDRVDERNYYELFWEAYRNSYLSQGQSRATAGVNASNVLTGSSGLVYNAYNVPGNTLVDPTTGKLNQNANLLWHESWEDALFRTASRTNANVNISGANEGMDYYLSAGYLNEDGIVRNSGYKRYNVRLNVNVAATNWFTTGVNLDGAIAKRKDVPSGGTATTNPFYYTRQMGPIYPVYQHNLTTGAFVDTLGEHKLDWGVPEQMGTRPYAGRSNLRGSLALDDRSRDIFNGNANAYAEVKFLKDFSFRATLGLNYLTNAITNYQNNQFGDAAPSTPGGSNGGRSTKTSDQQVSLTGNQVLTWRKTFGYHSVRALVGHENYKYKYTFLSANSSGFLFPGQSDLDNGTASFGPASSRVDNHRIESYFANVNYDFNQKYLLSASYRTDGSSRFRDDVRWGNFYSVGAGWRLSQEKFLSNVSWLNELKLRVSYGEQGNENIGLFYPYRNYYYANANGTYSAPTRPANAELLWEKNKTSNVGLDFTILKRRLSGTIEWFNRASDNLLFDVPLPPSTGYASVYQNVGSMKNTGIELQLGYNVILTPTFNWRMDLNLTHFKNKITKLPAKQSENGIITGTKKLLVGHSIFDFWLPEYAGVDASNGDPLYYRDVLDAAGKPTGARTLTNVIAQATSYYHGSALPDISGGFTNSVNYKGFDLSFLLTFAYGGQFYDGNYQSIMHRGSAGTALHVDALKRWQNPGDVTVVPRIQNAVAAQDGASSRWLVDGSWLNIKNITLSYTLPRALLNKLRVSGLQVFANVDNAWLFTAKKGMDPQREFNGTADASYTPFRTMSFGFTANLQ